MELHIGICDDILLQRSILIEFVKTYLDKRGILFKIYDVIKYLMIKIRLKLRGSRHED